MWTPRALSLPVCVYVCMCVIFNLAACIQEKQVEEMLRPLEGKCFTYQSATTAAPTPHVFQWCHGGRATVQRGRTGETRMPQVRGTAPPALRLLCCGYVCVQLHKSATHVIKPLVVGAIISSVAPWLIELGVGSGPARQCCCACERVCGRYADAGSWIQAELIRMSLEAA